MIEEFKKFINRGNVIDLAVGLVIGAAFGTVVKSFVDDILMPPIGRLIGDVDFTNLFINLSDTDFASLAEAQEAGAATINYGIFFNNLLSFIIVAFAVFLVARSYNKMREADEATPAETEKECPHCRMRVPIPATRCAHCTSELAAV